MSDTHRTWGLPQPLLLPARWLGRRRSRRQVSWLSGLRLRPPSRFPSGILALGFPTTVAGAASESGLTDPSPCSLLIPVRGTVACLIRALSLADKAFADHSAAPNPEAKTH